MLFYLAFFLVDLDFLADIHSYLQYKIGHNENISYYIMINKNYFNLPLF